MKSRIDFTAPFVTALFFTAVLSATTLALTACADDEPAPLVAPDTHVFTGRVYDGVTGERITDYDLTITSAGTTDEADINEDGVYETVAVYPNKDFTIAIDAEGYRSFLSHNSFDTLRRVTGTRFLESVVYYYYDAYLYPRDLASPPATIRVFASDVDLDVQATLRLQPTSGSDLITAAAAVIRNDGVAQVWQNDDDLQRRTITKQVKDGVASFEEGELVYGVTYAATIFSAFTTEDDDDQRNFYADAAFTYTPGYDGDRVVVVEPLETSPLALTFISTDLGEPDRDGKVTFVFNADIEFDPLKSNRVYRRAIDCAVSIDSDNQEPLEAENTLRECSTSDDSARGTLVTVEDNRLTIEWDAERGLETRDPNDIIRAVTYAGFDAVLLRKQGTAISTQRSLADMLSEYNGATTITVVLR